jgi:hypothetical protein
MDELLKLCTQYKVLEGTLLSTEDIDARWHEIAPEYVADAVPNIADYPTVAIAWAGYAGMAIAHLWDEDWTTHCKDGYKSLYGPAGFDDMDENIVQNVLGLSLDSPEAIRLEEVMRGCAQTAITQIRHEQIEGQTTRAFYVFARTARVMFRIGAALELKRLGYRFEKVDTPVC